MAALALWESLSWLQGSRLSRQWAGPGRGLGASGSLGSEYRAGWKMEHGQVDGQCFLRSGVTQAGLDHLVLLPPGTPKC